MAMGKGGGLLVLVVAVAGLLLHAAGVADAQTLRLAYYNQTCRSAESIVADEVQKAANADRSVLASLIRLHFHDCFVNGCDGSVLLESSDGQAEKNARPNLSLRGFDVIDRIKARLEAACALTVSCADIVAFAARDSVKLSGGVGYAVPGGRQDGTVSRASMTGDLPPPTQRDVDQLAQYFYRKGLTLDDMVILSGAHTVGIAHCSSFDYRLTSDQDKGMDAAFRNNLRSKCQYNPSNYAPLDAGSQYGFDASYFANVLANRTVLDSDAALNSPRTADRVRQWKNNPDWFKTSFASAMVKMGSIRGTYPGKVRANCRKRQQYKRRLSYLAAGYCLPAIKRSVRASGHGGAEDGAAVLAGGGGAAAGGGGAAARAGAAARGLLRQLVPRGGDHRAAGGEQGGGGQPGARRRPAPAPLPRLLRQGVRRVGVDRLDQGQHGGEGRRAQHQPAGLRRHRPHQGARRAGLLRRRLLRGHPRLRRQGQRRAGRRERVPGAGGAPRRVGVARVGHERQPAAADGERGAADADVRRQGPDAEGHGHPLRRAHHRLLALQLLQQPAVAVGHHGGAGAGPHHGPRLRGAAGAAVPAGRGPAGAHGRRLPQRLRRGLLQGRHGQPRPPVVRPGAAQRQEHGRAGGHLRQRPGHVPERLRRGHGQDGLRRRAHRQQRQGQGQLQSRLIELACHIHDAHQSLWICVTCRLIDWFWVIA